MTCDRGVGKSCPQPKRVVSELVDRSLLRKAVDRTLLAGSEIEVIQIVDKIRQFFIDGTGKPEIGENRRVQMPQRRICTKVEKLVWWKRLDRDVAAHSRPSRFLISRFSRTDEISHEKI
ncbi:hypothetical protein K435DRAFT_901046, partial [Dendrothele bispora CBS 962.96]